MRPGPTLAAAILVALPAHAEVLSLICEHDSGLSTKTGMPVHGYTEIFRIDFDVDENKVITPFFAALEVSFSVTDFSISWRFRLVSDNETYGYQFNRTTGTLFVDIATADDRIVAKGRCTKPKRLL